MGERWRDGGAWRGLARDLVVSLSALSGLARALITRCSLLSSLALICLKGPSLAQLSAAPPPLHPRRAALVKWLEGSLKSPDPWARFAARARALQWSEALSDSEQASLLALGHERGLNQDLKRWLQALHALKTARPELPSLLKELGFLNDPWINAGSVDPSAPLSASGWRRLPPQLKAGGLYPVTPWGPTGYYALWALRSAQAQRVTLCLTLDATLHLWLNGEAFDSEPSAERLWLDQRCWLLPFKEGVNQLMFAVSGKGLWGARLLNDRRRPASLTSTLPPWGAPQRGLDQRPQRLEDKVWSSLVSIVDRATERGERGRAELSDEGLLGVGLYASLAGVPEAQRLSPVIEAHLRWERGGGLTTLETFEALTPPELRAQSWADYPPPSEALSGVSGQRALRLWLSCVRDHLREGRFTEARVALQRARALYPDQPLWALEEAQLRSELGLSHSAYQLISDAFHSSGDRLSSVERGVLGQQLLRATWEASSRQDAQRLMAQLMRLGPSVASRVARAWLELSLELTDAELNAIGGARAVEERAQLRSRLSPGPYAWSTPLLAAELSSAQGHWEESLKWLASPTLADLPSAFTLKAEVLYALKDLRGARLEVARALSLAPRLEAALTLRETLSDERAPPPGAEAELPSPLLGPPLAELIRGAPWSYPEGDLDPPPVRLLYDHAHLELDAQGRLERRQRVVAEVLKPSAAGAWRVIRVPHQPALETLSLGSLARVRDGEHARPKVTHEGLSDVEARVYYDAVAEVIDFGPLKRGDLLTWEWRSIERQPDLEGVRAHGALIPLQGRAPIALKRLSLGPRAQARLHLSVEPRDLWLQRSPEGLTLRGVPATRLEPHGPRGSSAMSYAHLSVLRSWESIRALYRQSLTPLLTPTPQLQALAERWTRGAGSVEERVRALYLEVTQRVRYVGLEFGQHSFTPAPPLETLTRGYGDCKDRAALMIALARSIGLELQFAMVRTASAGRVEIDGAASLGAFNHAALYSPDLRRFLDPTVTYHDPWVLPADDQGAQALIVPLGEGDMTSQGLSLIPYQSSDVHLERVSFSGLEPGDTLRWERSGLSAAEARGLLEQRGGELNARVASTQATFTRLLPALDPRALEGVKVRGLSPAVDPLTLEGTLAGALKPLRATPERVVQEWSLISRFAPTATRQSAWRQLPRAFELCLPTSLTAKTSPRPLDISSHAQLHFSLSGDLSCARLTLSGGELSPADYLERRAWLIEAERALTRWLPSLEDPR